MNKELIELSKYRLEKAKEDLKHAHRSYEEGFLKGALNRSYYSIFHAMRSVLALDGLDSKKHSGVISMFIKNYVKPGTFETKLSEIILNASDIRNESDYEDFYIVSDDEVKEQLENADYFINKIELYLNSVYENES